MKVLYFSDIESLEDCIEQHQENSFTHYVTYNKTKHFGQEDVDLSRLKTKIQFYSSKKSPFTLDFSGTPYMCVGRWSLLCHLGKDLGRSSKEKYKKEKLDETHSTRKCISKKIDCPASIPIMHVAKFPEYSFNLDKLTSVNKTKIRANLMEKLKMKRMVIENCYCMTLPSSDDHKRHPFVTPVHSECPSNSVKMIVSNVSTLDKRKVNRNRDKLRRTKEPLDRRVMMKLFSIIKLGICDSVPAIKSELNRFVIEDIFAGKRPPPAMFRRYNPTSRDIINALHKFRSYSAEMRLQNLKAQGKGFVKELYKIINLTNEEEKLEKMLVRLKDLIHLEQNSLVNNMIVCSPLDECVEDTNVISIMEQDYQEKVDETDYDIGIDNSTSLVFSNVDNLELNEAVKVVIEIEET